MTRHKRNEWGKVWKEKMKLESRHEKEKSPHSLLSNTEKEKSPHSLLSNTLFLFYKHQHYVPWIVTGVKMVKQVKVWNWCKCIKMFWYAEIISVARAHTKFIAFDSISCHYMSCHIFQGVFQGVFSALNLTSALDSLSRSTYPCNI